MMKMNNQKQKVKKIRGTAPLFRGLNKWKHSSSSAKDLFLEHFMIIFVSKCQRFGRGQFLKCMHESFCFLIYGLDETWRVYQIVDCPKFTNYHHLRFSQYFSRLLLPITLCVACMSMVN